MVYESFIIISRMVDTLVNFIVHISGGKPIWMGFWGGVFTTLLNTLGAALVLMFRNPSQRFMDASLGFAAGVMLAASFTSLILPGVEMGGIVPVIIGILAGSFFLDVSDHLIPHMHSIIGTEGLHPERIKAVWLFIIAITLHNMPEGLAVGVSFGSGKVREAIVLMIAIGIQNIPEGFSVAVSAISAGYTRGFYAIYTGIRSGLVEIPLALLGAWAVHKIHVIIPYAMGFAAGAMLYVISDEIVPETHRKGHERYATFGTIMGIVVMLYLDMVFG